MLDSSFCWHVNFSEHFCPVSRTNTGLYNLNSTNFFRTATFFNRT